MRYEYAWLLSSIDDDDSTLMKAGEDGWRVVQGISVQEWENGTTYVTVLMEREL